MFLPFDLVISLLGINFQEIKEKQSNFININIAVLFLIIKIDKKGTRLNMHIHDKSECVLVHLQR